MEHRYPRQRRQSSIRSTGFRFFAAVTGLLDAEALRKAVADSVPSAFVEMNLKAFDQGFEHGLAKTGPDHESHEAEHASAIEGV